MGSSNSVSLARTIKGKARAYTTKLACKCQSSPSDMKCVVYYTNWSIYQRKFNPDQIPADCITHVNYSFAKIDDTTGDVKLSDEWADVQIKLGDNDEGLKGCLGAFFQMKKKYRHLRVILAIGGWGYDGKFSAVCNDANKRARFVQTAVGLVEECGLDGIDIDWEYPKDATEAALMVSLLKELREALTKLSDTHNSGVYKFLLTVAAPGGPDKIQTLNVEEMDKYLDWWNLMCYDFAGGWDSISGHQSQLYGSPLSVDAVVSSYTKRGVDTSRLVVGMPAYGRAFENTDGPGKPFSGTGTGSWENGVWDYKALPLAGSEEKYLQSIGACYSYDAPKRKMVSYDNEQVVKQKCEYIKAKKLGGAMFWEASGDHVASNARSLIGTVNSNLNLAKSATNNLTYPGSSYSNVKAA
ncbi:glycoside hydrolase family 18 protein [Tortispora caseinolytica NRRL Y-17796]|uniref:chitinase n=1 Tax=Tortispora caseinolytica NRRL Y-17796 TaxID=767744 RepID=A0A1E4TM61_9ASCO|nr:glycoside hydrolase family 18 protein [Tortispora caseinolytica NRRL Y-17796]